MGNVAKDITSGLSGFFFDIVKSIQTLSDNIKQFFSDLLDGILDGIKSLFVPTKSYGEDLRITIECKFPFVSQVIDIVNSLLNLGNNAVPPKFEFTYQGATVSIVEFDSFSAFMPIIHSIILAVAWLSYIMRLYKRLPSIIGGFR